MRVAITTLLALCPVAGLAQPSPPSAPSGRWVDGSDRPCVPLDRYPGEPRVPLPAGCVAFAPGWWVPDPVEESRRVALAELRAEAGALRDQLVGERAAHDRTRAWCSVRLDAAGRDLQDCGQVVQATAPVAGPSRPLWAAFGTGATLACGAAVFVALAGAGDAAQGVGAGVAGAGCGLGMVALGWAWR